MSKIPANRTIVGLVCRQQTKYLIAGAITAVLHFAIFSGGWLVLRDVVPYPLVAIGAQALTVLAVYPAYRVVVFHATGPWIPGLIRFYLACAAVLLLSVVSLVSLVEVARLPVPVAQIVTALWSPVVAYPVQRFWTFRKPVAGSQRGASRVSTSYPGGKRSQKGVVSAGSRGHQ